MERFKFNGADDLTGYIEVTLQDYTGTALTNDRIPTARPDSSRFDYALFSMSGIEGYASGRITNIGPPTNKSAKLVTASAVSLVQSVDTPTSPFFGRLTIKSSAVKDI